MHNEDEQHAPADGQHELLDIQHGSNWECSGTTPLRWRERRAGAPELAGSSPACSGVQAAFTFNPLSVRRQSRRHSVDRSRQLFLSQTRRCSAARV